MADSSQKILKELSDLTRNLDVLAKEIRAMNKNTASVQEAVVKSVEKKESSDDKSAGNKSETPDAGKVIAETKKKQDSMFSRLLESIKKSSEEGNNEIKKAGLEGIKNAGRTLLKTGSLKDAAKSGLSGILSSSKDSIIDSIRRKKEEKNATIVEGVTSTEGLKEKERAKKEEESVVEAKESAEKKNKETEKKDKKSILEKLNIKKKSKEEKIEEQRKKEVEEKIEKKSLLSRIKEKISTKDSKKEDALTNPKKEKINTEGSTVVSVQEKKEPPSLKALTPGITSEKSPEERISLKEKSKRIFQKTTLGSTIKSFSDAIKKKRNENVPSSSSVKSEPEQLSTQSKVEKVETELKSKSKKKEPVKEKSETPVDKEVTTPIDKNKLNESKESGKNNESKSESEKEGSDNKSPEITAQDIADIKSLLSSMNSALNGPLNIKNNKPYRPHSNMLE